MWRQRRFVSGQLQSNSAHGILQARDFCNGLKKKKKKKCLEGWADKGTDTEVQKGNHCCEFIRSIRKHHTFSYTAQSCHIIFPHFRMPKTSSPSFCMLTFNSFSRTGKKNLQTREDQKSSHPSMCLFCPACHTWQTPMSHPTGQWRQHRPRETWGSPLTVLTRPSLLAVSATAARASLVTYNNSKLFYWKMCLFSEKSINEEWNSRSFAFQILIIWKSAMNFENWK